jgi:hypothetical protein
VSGGEVARVPGFETEYVIRGGRRDRCEVFTVESDGTRYWEAPAHDARTLADALRWIADDWEDAAALDEAEVLRALEDDEGTP